MAESVEVAPMVSVTVFLTDATLLDVAYANGEDVIVFVEIDDVVLEVGADITNVFADVEIMACEGVKVGLICANLVVIVLLLVVVTVISCKCSEKSVIDEDDIVDTAGAVMFPVGEALDIRKVAVFGVVFMKVVKDLVGDNVNDVVGLFTGDVTALVVEDIVTDDVVIGCSDTVINVVFVAMLDVVIGIVLLGKMVGIVNIASFEFSIIADVVVSSCVVNPVVYVDITKVCMLADFMDVTPGKFFEVEATEVVTEYVSTGIRIVVTVEVIVLKSDEATDTICFGADDVTVN